VTRGWSSFDRAARVAARSCITLCVVTAGCGATDRTHENHAKAELLAEVGKGAALTPALLFDLAHAIAAHGPSGGLHFMVSCECKDGSVYVSPVVTGSVPTVFEMQSSRYVANASKVERTSRMMSADEVLSTLGALVRCGEMSVTFGGEAVTRLRVDGSGRIVAIDGRSVKPIP
jgi:hypothetical protein